MHQNKPLTVVVSRLIIGMDKPEKTMLFINAIVAPANRDATNTFTYLRVEIDGRRFNWQIVETPEELNAMINGASDNGNIA